MSGCGRSDFSEDARACNLGTKNPGDTPDCVFPSPRLRLFFRSARIFHPLFQAGLSRRFHRSRLKANIEDRKDFLKKDRCHRFESYFPLGFLLIDSWRVIFELNSSGFNSVPLKVFILNFFLVTGRGCLSISLRTHLKFDNY